MHRTKSARISDSAETRVPSRVDSRERYQALLVLGDGEARADSIRPDQDYVGATRRIGLINVHSAVPFVFLREATPARIKYRSPLIIV